MSFFYENDGTLYLKSLSIKIIYKYCGALHLIKINIAQNFQLHKAAELRNICRYTILDKTKVQRTVI